MKTTLICLLFSVVAFAKLDTIPEVYATPEDFAKDSSVIIDSTFRLHVLEKSKDPSDPDYAIIYTTSRGRRRYYNDKAFAIRVGSRYFIRDRSDVFGPARYRPIKRCPIVSYYSLISTSMYNHARKGDKKGGVTKTWYMIYMEEEGMIKPLTAPRVREVIIRKYPLMYNEFASHEAHSLESLFSYLDRICK